MKKLIFLAVLIMLFAGMSACRNTGSKNGNSSMPSVISGGSAGMSGDSAGSGTGGAISGSGQSGNGSTEGGSMSGSGFYSGSNGAGSGSNGTGSKPGGSNANSEAYSKPDPDIGSSDVEDVVLKEFKVGSFIYDIKYFSGYWKFDRHKDMTVKDLSGNGNNIMLNELALQKTSVSGLSLRMTDAGNAVISNNKDLWGSNSYTINFWMKFAKSSPNDASIISKTMAAPYEYRLWLSNTGALYVLSSEKIQWYGSNSVQKIWSSLNRDILMDEWAMLTMTYDGSQLKSYVNGKLDISRPLDAGAASKSSSSAIIGAEKAYNVPGVDGWMDELFFAKKAMSAAEIASLYAAYGHPSEVPAKLALPSGIDTVKSDNTSVISPGSNFTSPANDFRQLQYSMSYTPDLNTFKLYGIGGVVLSAYHNNYLNSQYVWSNLKNDVQLSKDAGFKIWFYDEDLYPTGAAGGLVVKDHPELEARGVYEMRLQGSGTAQKTVTLPVGGEKFVAVVLYPVVNNKPDYSKGKSITPGADSVTFTGISGNWVLCYYVERVLRDNYATESRKNYWQAGGLYPNMLNADAGRRYIELTHQQYKDKLGSLFGYITAFYTGEPAIAIVNTLTTQTSSRGQKIIPWDDALPAKFKSMHGYDLALSLGEIYDTPSGSPSVPRMHFLQTVATMFSENFFGQYAKWCDQNGAALSGHILYEESMSAHVPFYGDFLQCASNFQIAGYDNYVISHGGDVTDNILAAKYSFSPVRHRGVHLAQSLYEPIVSGYYGESADTGNNIDPDISVYRSNTNFMVANGVNYFNNYAPYRPYVPSVYKKFMDYQSRLAYLLRGAIDDTQIAVYYNIETYQARYAPTSNENPSTKAHNAPFLNLNNEQRKIFSELYKANINFNVLGRYDFDRVTVSNGKLNISGYSYSAIIMPTMDIIPLSVLQKLDAFQKGGGKLTWCGKIPKIGAYPSENSQVAAITSKFTSAGSVDGSISIIIRMTSPAITFFNPTYPEALSFSAFKGDINKNGKSDNAFFIVNNKYAPNKFRLYHKSAKTATIYDPADGKAATVSIPFDITVAEYSGIVVVFE